MAGDAPQPAERFDSWKEIAAYLHRDERTVQRWERERRLPVHRTPGARRGTIFAFRTEIDAWLHGVDVTELRPRPQPRRRPWLLAAITLCVLLVAWTAARSLRPRPPAHDAALLQNTVVGQDENGRTLWRHPLPAEPARPHRLLRLGTPGRRAYIVVTHAPDPHSSQALVTSLDEYGEVRWTYAPQHTFRFGDREASGPWSIYDIATAREGASGLWMTVVHRLMGYSYVVRLDPETGREELRFVNTGTLWPVAVVPTPAGDRVFVGGFNNEYDAGILAVLDASAPFAVSPQAPGSRHECTSCPRAAAPLQYLVFGRTELNRAERIDLNLAGMVHVIGGRVEVSTFELSHAARRIYSFSAEPEPRLVAALSSSTYWREHRRLEEEGKVRHAAERCPERLSPPPVRAWEGGQGWRVLAVHLEDAPPPAAERASRPVHTD